MSDDRCMRKLSVCKPVPGCWYVGDSGQLQQVRVVLHESGNVCRLITENISGVRKLMDIAAWYQLDFALHSLGMKQRRRQRTPGNSPEAV